MLDEISMKKDGVRAHPYAQIQEVRLRSVPARPGLPSWLGQRDLKRLNALQERSSSGGQVYDRMERTVDAVSDLADNARGGCADVLTFPFLLIF